MPGLTGYTIPTTAAGEYISRVMCAPTSAVFYEVLPDVSAHVRPLDRVPHIVITLCIEQNDIVNWSKPPAFAMSARSSPDYFVPKIV